MNLLNRLLAVASAAFFIVGSASAQTSGTVTNHAFAIGKGAGTTGYTSLLCGSAQLAVGQSAADPICKTISGDVTITAAGVTAIGASKVSNSQLATMAANTTKCNATAGTANPTDCTGSTMRTNLGVVIGTNVEAWDADLDCVAALSSTGVIKRTGAGTCSAGSLALSDLATGSLDTVIGYFGSTTSSAISINNCAGALTYSTTTHTFGCNAGLGAGSVAAGGGGLVPTSGGPSTLYIEQMNPGGRVTVVSGGCTVTTDQVAQTNLYYAPCAGEWVPVYDGTNMQLRQFTSSATDTVGLTIALGSNWAANTLYDAFVGLNGGTVTFCTGPAWTSSTSGSSSRGTGAGTTQLALYKGLQTNAVSMTCRYGNATTFTCGVNQCTYVGTVLTGASTGTVDLKFGTNAVNCGQSILSIYNQFNQQNVRASVSNTTASWTYSTQAWRAAAGQSTCSVLMVAGQQTNAITATYTDRVGGAASGSYSNLGIGLNSSTSLAARAASMLLRCAACVVDATGVATMMDNLALGLNSIYAIEAGDGVNANSFQGQNSSTPGLQQQLLTVQGLM